MSKLAGITRAALLGVLFAMVAFSYALATSGGLSEGGASAAVRAVGSSTLDFTNPLHASGDRDLGDAVVGSGLVRYCRAKGGVAPYKFSSTNIVTGLTLQSNGMVIGSLAKTVTDPVRFYVTVTDSYGTNPNKDTEPFRITVVAGTAFRFAVGPKLGTAVQNQPFVAQLEVINGKAPFQFSIDAGATLAGAAVTMEDMGLAVANDGVIYGVPLQSGLLKFKAQATDSSTAKAMERSPGTGTGQSFELEITANLVSTSTILATGIQIKGGAAGKDSIKYAGLVNLVDKKVADLSGQKLTMRIGSYVAPVSEAFDAKGKTAKPTSKTAASTVASVSSKGQLKVAVAKEDFKAAASSVFGALSGGQALLPVEITVGEVVVGTQAVLFTLAEKSPKYSLTYKAGAPVPGGNFMMTAIAGKDDTKGPVEGSAWKVAFIAQPAAEGKGKSGLKAGSFGGSTEAIVSIGTGFSGKIAVTESKGKIKSGKLADSKAGDQIKKLAMDSSKGKGSLQTTFVAAAKSGIPEGGLGKLPKTSFAMNVLLNDNKAAPVYEGEGGAAIYMAKSGWTSKQPK